MDILICAIGLTLLVLILLVALIRRVSCRNDVIPFKSLENLQPFSFDRKRPILPDTRYHVEESRPPRSMPEVIRSTELFRYMENDAFENVLESTEVMSFEEGQYLPPIEDFALFVVLDGTMDVLLFDSAYDGNEVRHLKPNLLKTVKSGGSLTPMPFVLSFLTTALSKGDGRHHKIPHVDGVPNKGETSSLQLLKKKIRLQAGKDTKVALIPLTTLSLPPLSHPKLALYLSEAAIRRFYFITFPICRNYFGLHKEILRFEEELCTTVLESSAQEFPSLSMLLWLQQARQDQVGPIDLNSPKGIVLSVSLSSPQSMPSSFDETQSGSDSIIANRADATASLIRSRRRSSRTSLAELRIEVPGSPTKQSPKHSKFLLPSLLSQTENNLFQSVESILSVPLLNPKPTVLEALRYGVAAKISHALGLAEEDHEPVNNVEPSEINISPGWDDNPSVTLSPSSLQRKLQDEIELILFPKGSVLAHEGERYPGLYYVIHGHLVAQAAPAEHMDEDGEEIPSFEAGAGAIVGYGCLLSNNRSILQIKASTDTYVGFLPRNNLNQVVTQHPQVLLTLGKRMLEAIPEIINMVSIALEWMEFGGGQTVYERGDPSDALYIVLNGRLRTSEMNPSSGIETTREIGRSESVGALELYTTRRRPAKLFAIRRSELVRIQLSSYKCLSMSHPPLAFSLSKIIAASAPSLIENSVSTVGLGTQAGKSGISIISVFSLSQEVPVERFSSWLADAVAATGIRSHDDMVVLDSAAVIKAMGESIFDKRGNIQLEDYLSHLQVNVSTAIFIADSSENSTWTRKCIAHADMMLFIGMADGSPSIAAIEKTVLELGTFAQKNLILLHEEKSAPVPGIASTWLKERKQMYDGCRHLLFPPRRTEPKCSPSSIPLLNENADIHRLARHLFGKSIALVLGGGGARGISHLGVLQAFEEEGIPIDIVGGTSIGAFVGAIYSRELSSSATFTEVKKFSHKMRNWRFLPDLTFPRLSVTTGAEFNRAVQHFFGQQQFSDLWLDFYCSVTNLTKNCIAQTVSRGNLWESTRASMSVAGFVPPLCSDGDMLLDGCYSANVPATPARGRGADIIFAIDVSVTNQYSPLDYGPSLSGWQLLCQHYLPSMSHFADPVWTGQAANDSNIEKTNESGKKLSSPPSYSELTERLSFATALYEIEQLKKTPGCHYFRQPVSNYKSTDFDQFEKIYQIGYASAKEWVRELKMNKVFDGLAIFRNVEA